MSDNNYNNIQDAQDSINNIMGYGKVIKVLTGLYQEDDEKHGIKKGDKKIETFHMTPSSLINIPKTINKLEVFLDNAGNIGDEKAMDAASDLIVESLKKMHPNITKREVKEKFGLVGLVSAIKYVLEINDFLSQIRQIQDQLTEAYQNSGIDMDQQLMKKKQG